MKCKYSFFFVFLLIGCQGLIPNNDKWDPRKDPVHSLQSYSFIPAYSLAEISNKPSLVIMNYLKELDNREDYEAYELSELEKKTLNDELAKLPGLTQKILKERTVGIYFVKNLWGSGITDYIINSNGEIYTFIAINPALFKMNLGDWLSNRDSSCFIKDNFDYEIRFKVPEKATAIQGVLLHETTHVVDYVLKITPYPENGFSEYNRKIKPLSTFTDNIWRGITSSCYDNTFILRDKITFYGFNHGPMIKMSEAVTVYSQLESTPFISLYGSQSWAEDVAEYVMYYQLTKQFKTELSMQIFNPTSGKLYYTLEITNRPQVKDRFKEIARIFD